jgi:F0F1-type ATP synthase membrane subunit b/b'
MVDQSLIYILILIIAVLVMLCIGLVILYIKELSSKKDYVTGDDQSQTDSKVFEKAESKSQKILEEAYTKAREIVSDADNYLKKEESELAKAVDRAQEVYTHSYNEAIKSTEIKAEQMIQSIPQDIKVTLISVIDSFRVSLTDEIKRAQGDANKVITEAYKQAMEGVEKYKEERLKEVDDSILDIVKDVTEKVLGKTLSLEEHEKLVHKALEEAKRQKIF